MPAFDQMFRFEASTVRLADGGHFRPLLDGVQRWIRQGRELYDGLGSRFTILYEVSDSRFVLVEYRCCHAETAENPGGQLQIWSSDSPPRAMPVTNQDAFRLLCAWQSEIPPSLEPLASIEARNVSKPPRPLKDWVERGYLVRVAATPAHDCDRLQAAEQIAAAAVRCVQDVRRWSEGRQEPEHRCWREFAARLFCRFTVDPARWWGSPQEIPPQDVGLDAMRWPGESQTIRAILRRLQELLAEPLALVAAEAGGAAPGDWPTREESAAAQEALVEALPQLESLALQLKNAVVAARAAQHVKPGSKPPKAPAEDAIRIYRLWLTTGAKQEELARLFTQATRRPMDQGTVSRKLTQVHAWIEAGNALPEIGLPAPRSTRTVDPNVLDLGANQEFRTPRQRGKRSS